MTIREFIDRHYRHFNAATLRAASRAYAEHVDGGGAMMITLAGAMSTAEIGRSLAEMIRQDKVHAITTTGANLEEDLFNLVAHDHYVSIPDWRDLTAAREAELAAAGLNRVTDTCIPEQEAFRRVEAPLLTLWREAAAAGERRPPHEFLYRLVTDAALRPEFQADPADSWLLAAAERQLPLYVPGWEDSTLGNVYVAERLRGRLAADVVAPGTDYLAALAEWYAQTTMGCTVQELPTRSAAHAEAPPSADPSAPQRTVGFFQIGGGIAGDFPICVVPMLRQDLCRAVPTWGYFCQISDSTTSYGSYSGAVPAEKITWGKLAPDTPMFVIESDATIVAPLVFAHVLGW